VRLQLVVLNPLLAPGKLLLLDKPTRTKIPSGIRDVFACGRSQEFSAKLAKIQNSKIELLSEQKTKRCG
jgi:hypothetical protein